MLWRTKRKLELTYYNILDIDWIYFRFREAK